MGEVYRAVHATTGQVVAIKVLGTGTLGSIWVHRFNNEARLQATLNHPNVARLYGYLEFDRRPCIVMEYVDGQTLADRLHQCGALPVDEAMRILVALTEAVAYVHEKKIVHRDLKPANIRLTRSGVVKLLDFGIAKGESSPSLTMTGQVIGTPAYLSPEQLDGGEATIRSDIWALGVVFYEMVAGRPPFEGQTLTEVRNRIHSAAYHRLSEAVRLDAATAPATIAKLDRIVARCLTVDPAARLATPRELARELRGVREEPPGEPEARHAPAGPWLAEALRASVEPLRRQLTPRTGLETLRRAVHAGLERSWAVLAGLAILILVVVLAAPWLRPTTDGRRSLQRIDVVEGSAEVYIDGVLRGPTPLEFEARPGRAVDVELRQRGFAPYRTRLDIGARDQHWTITMQRTESVEGGVR
jgi:serine/threonine-protein kinase